MIKKILNFFSKDKKEEKSNIFNDKEKFLETFTLKGKPFKDISEDIKKNIFLENSKCIKGLTEEDKIFVANTLYNQEMEFNYIYTFKDLRSFLFEKLHLKYKYLAENILHNQRSKAIAKLERIQCLQNGIKKANWIYFGGHTCSIESHKFYHKKVFDLEKGLFDKNLNKYVLPSESEQCSCYFMPIVEI